MKKALKWIIMIAIAIVAAWLLWVFIINGEKKSYSEPLAAVVIEKPQRKNVNESLTFNGFIEAQAMIPVVPFVSGTLESYFAKAGDYVEKDQILAVVDKEPYELQVKQAEALYLAAEATFERINNLYLSGAVSQQNYDEAKAQYDAYKAQYDLAEVQLGYTNVKAPVSGTVLMADSSEGSVATQTSPLYVIADLSKLEINLNIPEKYFDVLNCNKDKIKAVVSRNGANCNAEVTSIAPYVSSQSKTFAVTIRLTDNVDAFRPGMFVSVKLIYNEIKNALVLDWAVQNSDTSIYSYDEETQQVKYEKINITSSDENCFVIDEKYKDTWFVVDGQGSLLDGQKVNVL